MQLRLPKLLISVASLFFLACGDSGTESGRLVHRDRKSLVRRERRKARHALSSADQDSGAKTENLASIELPSTGLAAEHTSVASAQSSGKTTNSVEANTQACLLLNLGPTTIPSYQTGSPQEQGAWTNHLSGVGDPISGIRAVPNAEGDLKAGGGMYEFSGKSKSYLHIEKLHFPLNLKNKERIQEMAVEIKFQTSVSGERWYDNWSLLDFDRSEWFNVFVDGNDGLPRLCSVGLDGIQDAVKGNTKVNDGYLQTITATFKTDGNSSSKFTMSINNTDSDCASCVVLNKHKAGLGDIAKKRYGIIGDGSEAGSDDGRRNKKYFKGTIHSIKLCHGTGCVNNAAVLDQLPHCSRDILKDENGDIETRARS